MQRIDHMGSIFGIDQEDHASSNRDEIWMRDIKTSPVRKANLE